jgi:hypothetical protein
MLSIDGTHLAVGSSGLGNRPGSCSSGKPKSGYSAGCLRGPADQLLLVIERSRRCGSLGTICRSKIVSGTTMNWCGLKSSKRVDRTLWVMVSAIKGFKHSKLASFLLCEHVTDACITCMRSKRLDWDGSNPRYKNTGLS